jgi:hypothetical protein
MTCFRFSALGIVSVYFAGDVVGCYFSLDVLFYQIAALVFVLMFLMIFAVQQLEDIFSM